MDENNRVTPRECRGAKEYAKRRLRESDEPMSPKELADEYDCSGSHMRSQVSDLKQNGEIESVTYGYYDVNRRRRDTAGRRQQTTNTRNHADAERVQQTIQRPNRRHNRRHSRQYHGNTRRQNRRRRYAKQC